MIWLLTNPFVPNVPFLYHEVFCFQGVEEGVLGTNGLIHFMSLALRSTYGEYQAKSLNDKSITYLLRLYR